jgi:hypothetical protein
MDTYKDRKTGLVVFGVIEILLGGLCLLLAVASAFSAGLQGAAYGGDTVWPQMLPAVCVYLFAAVALTWLGIGSILARRWARALLLVSSWTFLVIGVGTLAVMLLVLPRLFAGLDTNANLPPAAHAIIMAAVASILAVMYVIWPGILVLFYGSRNVRATCEARDPVERWTDRCPLPVLAISLLMAFSALSMLSTAAFGFVVPFFGHILQGAAGAAVCAAIFVLLLTLARGCYRLRPAAWWGVVLLIAGGALSTVLTFSRHTMLDFYARMNFDDAQLDAVRNMNVFEGGRMELFTLAWALLFLVYMLAIRRFFNAPAPEASPWHAAPEA